MVDNFCECLPIMIILGKSDGAKTLTTERSLSGHNYLLEKIKLQTCTTDPQTSWNDERV